MTPAVPWPRIPDLDAILAAHAEALGGDLSLYRNHGYRVANLALILSEAAPSRREKLAIAAAFHDLGIWTDGSFDYLAPSVRLATEHLERVGQAAWIDEIAAMILNHHKISTSAGGGLVEAFQRADWADVSRGLRRWGLPRATIAALYAAFPDAGFHAKLVRLELGRLRTHPWNPLPMLRL